MNSTQGHGPGPSASGATPAAGRRADQHPPASHLAASGFDLDRQAADPGGSPVKSGLRPLSPRHRGGPAAGGGWGLVQRRPPSVPLLPHSSRLTFPVALVSRAVKPPTAPVRRGHALPPALPLAVCP